jgi:hypothetical protein
VTGAISIKADQTARACDARRFHSEPLKPPPLQPPISRLPLPGAFHFHQLRLGFTDTGSSPVTFEPYRLNIADAQGFIAPGLDEQVHLEKSSNSS